MKIFKPLLFVIFMLGVAGPMLAQSGDGLSFVDDRLNAEATVKVDIYPNPTADFITISVVNSKSNNFSVAVYNIIGNEISVESEKISANQTRLNLGNLNKGYYLVSIKDGNTNLKISTHKVFRK